MRPGEVLLRAAEWLDTKPNGQHGLRMAVFSCASPENGLLAMAYLEPLMPEFGKWFWEIKSENDAKPENVHIKVMVLLLAAAIAKSEGE